MINVAINGFGRIGRLVLRAGINDPKINFVAVNDLTNAPTLTHLLRYDSVHGPFRHDLLAKENSIQIDGKEIKVFAEKNPEKLPWKDLNIDVVMECTGFFTMCPLMRFHLKAGG